MCGVALQERRRKLKATDGSNTKCVSKGLPAEALCVGWVVLRRACPPKLKVHTRFALNKDVLINILLEHRQLLILLVGLL